MTCYDKNIVSLECARLSVVVIPGLIVYFYLYLDTNKVCNVIMLTGLSLYGPKYTMNIAVLI